MNAEERKNALKAELEALLAKHNASLELDVELVGWGGDCNVSVKVELHGEWDEDGNCLKESCELELLSR